MKWSPVRHYLALAVVAAAVALAAPQAWAQDDHAAQAAPPPAAAPQAARPPRWEWTIDSTAFFGFNYQYRKFRDHLVARLRGQFAHSDLQAPPTDAIGPAVSIAGVASFGRLSNSPTGRVNRLSQAVVNLAHQAGGHSFRAGVDFLHNASVIVFPRAIRGAYTFSSLANFLAGTYNNAGFTQTFGATDVTQANPNVGLYVHEEWKVRPAVTLNLGMRYDLQIGLRARF